jgi:hypothetical protein
MLCYLLDLALLICGIIALAKGRIQITKNKVCVGGPARVAGALLILAPLLGFSAELGIGFYKGVQIGINAAKNGTPPPNRPARWGGNDLPITQSELLQLQLVCALTHAGLMGVVTVAAVIVAVANAKPIRRRRRYEDDSDEDDDRPRRRRGYEDDDEYDDRPRRRSRDVSDDYEDDRPTRRRYRDDDDYR